MYNVISFRWCFAMTMSERLTKYKYKTRIINKFHKFTYYLDIFCDGAVKRLISKIFCNPEKRSIKSDSRLHFLRDSITDTCLLSSLDRFIVLIWKTDVDSRISVGSPCKTYDGQTYKNIKPSCLSRTLNSYRIKETLPYQF